MNSESDRQMKDREVDKITSLQQLADMAFDLIGSPVFISDASGRVLAYTEMAGEKDAAFEVFILRLLSDEKLSADALREQMKLLIRQENPYFYVLDIFPAIAGKWPKEISEIAEELREVPACHVVVYDEHVVCVLSMEQEYSHWENEQIPLTPILEKYGLLAGVSQAEKNISELRNAYLQAKNMSVIANRLKNGPIYYPFDEHAVYAMFEMADQQGTLRNFCHKKVLELEEYDTKHHTDLLPTLHAYLENSRSISKTAEIMFIHRNTVSYRINKCFEILGTRVENENELFSFNFSLRIIEYYNKKKGKLPPNWKY